LSLSIMKSNLICFLTALRFLTILPLPWYADRDSEYFAKCGNYFALVGLLIGIGGVILTSLLAQFLPPPLFSCVIILYLAIISGFLHLDGLADTADGFLSARPKEKILVIMHDSRSGAMGVIALVLLLLFKFAALLSIPTESVAAAVLFMPLAGRCALVISMAYLPCAREGGLGRLFSITKNLLTPALAILVVLVTGVFSDFLFAVLTLAALLSTVFLFGMWCRKVLGGTTGDTLGAVCELTETAVAMFFAIYLNL